MAVKKVTGTWSVAAAHCAFRSSTLSPRGRPNHGLYKILPLLHSAGTLHQARDVKKA